MRAEIHVASLEEVATIIDWAEGEGWNPSPYDAKAFFSADPKGFFISTMNDIPIGAISAVKWGSNFGFLGLYIVTPEYRSKGFGIQLWNHAMGYLSNHLIGLDGVVEQQYNYKKSGFIFAHNTIRFEGKAGDVSQFVHGENIIAYEKDRFGGVLHYDKGFFPASRKNFLANWLSIPKASVHVAFDEKGAVSGYVLARPCKRGYKIAPLFADNVPIARGLLHEVCAPLPKDAPVFLDVPEPNKNAQSLVTELGWREVFQTARMYTASPPPDIQLQKSFGLTSFEIG